MNATVDPVRLSREEHQAQKMISEGGPLNERSDGADAAMNDVPLVSNSPIPEDSWMRAKIETISAALGKRFVSILNRRKGSLTKSLDRVPRGMHKVANQTSLVLELIDDFKAGRYREVPWHTVAIASAGLLYTVNPADIVPNYLPIVGVLDDMAVIAVCTRWIHKDLVDYCRFKGYDVDEYFD